MECLVSGHRQTSAAGETIHSKRSASHGSLAAHLLTQPINRLLVFSFILVAVIPLSFFGVQLYKAAWDDTWREIHEKHRLLALNMASPISIYVEENQRALALMAGAFSQVGSHPSDGLELNGRHYSFLQDSSQTLENFQSITLLNLNGSPLFSNIRQRRADTSLRLRQAPAVRNTLASGRAAISPIQRSPFTDTPTILMSQPVWHLDGQLAGVLLAELKIDRIEALRKQVHFGKRGHSAIIDATGHVIAHPSPDWMATIKDLSGLAIVQHMLTGNSGVMEFHSPYLGQDMVAGYTQIPRLGWGIMVPQPKSEIQEQVTFFLSSQAGALLGALSLSVLIALILAKWITRPLKRLASAASDIAQNGFRGSLTQDAGFAPQEVNDLSHSLTDLLNGLQGSYRKIDDMNADLNKRINHATEELRAANIRLMELASLDHLTQLANRRHFESALEKSMQRRRSGEKSISLILIDIDDFKQINDLYGHAAGDAVLVQVAGILRAVTREGDLAARFAGDEFVLWMQCEEPVARQRAQEIINQIADTTFTWDGKNIKVTVSVGLSHLELDRQRSAQTLLQEADQAMYQAKHAGKNRIA